MFVEKEPQASKMLSARVDQEMFYSLKALSQQLGVGTSAITRLAVFKLLENAREEKPTTWDQLKNL
jgi:DNA-binding MurR/RpiR family transcriptional regulator